MGITAVFFDFALRDAVRSVVFDVAVFEAPSLEAFALDAMVFEAPALDGFVDLDAMVFDAPALDGFVDLDAMVFDAPAFDGFVDLDAMDFDAPALDGFVDLDAMVFDAPALDGFVDLDAMDLVDVDLAGFVDLDAMVFEAPALDASAVDGFVVSDALALVDVDLAASAGDGRAAFDAVALLPGFDGSDAPVALPAFVVLAGAAPRAVGPPDCLINVERAALPSDWQKEICWRPALASSGTTSRRFKTNPSGANKPASRRRSTLLVGRSLVWPALFERVFSTTGSRLTAFSATGSQTPQKDRLLSPCGQTGEPKRSRSSRCTSTRLHAWEQPYCLLSQ